MPFGRIHVSYDNMGHRLCFGRTKVKHILHKDIWVANGDVVIGFSVDNKNKHNDGPCKVFSL